MTKITFYYLDGTSQTFDKAREKNIHETIKNQDSIIIHNHNTKTITTIFLDKVKQIVEEEESQ